MNTTNRYLGIITISSKSFSQTIVEQGLSSIANNNILSSSLYCRMGTGTTEPSTTDLDLETPVSSYSNLASDQVDLSSFSIPTWFSVQRNYFFPVGTYNEESLTEIGFFDTNSGSPVLFSRTLIKDLLGNTTAIQVRPDESLTVTYEIRKYPPTEDVVGSFDVGGVSTDFILRPAQVSNIPSWGLDRSILPSQGRVYETNVLGTVFSSPSGVSEDITVSTSISSNTSFTQVTISSEIGNFTTGIGSLVLSSTDGDLYQISFTPKINKSSGIDLFIRNILTLTWENFDA